MKNWLVEESNATSWITRRAFRIALKCGMPTIGERVLLLNHVCQPANTPYRASHAIFVREGAEHSYDEVDQVPEVMRGRLLSLRAYDAAGMMLDADVVDGGQIEGRHHAVVSITAGRLHPRPQCETWLLLGPHRPGVNTHAVLYFLQITGALSKRRLRATVTKPHNWCTIGRSYNYH